MKEKESTLADRVKHKINVNKSVETLHNAAIEYSNWFWVEHSHNFSLANQKMCAQRTIDILNLDVNTAAQIQHAVIRAYTIADDMLKVNEVIQGHHLIVSGAIQGQLVGNLNTYTPPTPPDTSPLINITENAVELRNVPNAVGTLVQHTLQQNAAGKGSDAIKSVKNFNLSYDLIKDYEASALNDGLWGYTINAQTFNLSYNNIGATGIDHLVKGSIGMGYILSGGKDIHQTMQGIFTLPTTSIVHLNLCNNNIGDVGAEILCQALVNSKLPATKSIDVSVNNVTTTGFNYFKNAIGNTPNKDLVITMANVNTMKAAVSFFSSWFDAKIIEYKQNSAEAPWNTKAFATDQGTVTHCQKALGLTSGGIALGVVKQSAKKVSPLKLFYAVLRDGGPDEILNSEWLGCISDMNEKMFGIITGDDHGQLLGESNADCAIF